MSSHSQQKRGGAGSSSSGAGGSSSSSGSKGGSRSTGSKTSSGNSGGDERFSHRSSVDSGTSTNTQPQQRKVIGQYMLGKTIGEGTFGKVKIAVHLPTGEKVAVKILEKSRIKEQADVRRVNREIKILKKARHENIIQLYEVLDTPNTIYLMMENAEGGEMFDYIVAHRYVPEMQACKFFHQIVDGVEMLHKNDITHRDLKPENLLLKHSVDGWIVKIVDFGLSNTHEGGKLLSTACGSPCYAAPEMIAGKQYAGPVADIWSMGVILFALVCGFLPFEDANTPNLYRKIMAGEYKPAKWISSDVKDLIRRILDTDPRRRYSVADIRRHPWYQMVPDSAIPKDVTDNDKVKAETMQAMSEAGMDVQAVLDGLQSHACNSMTAMYYLLAQKSRGSQRRGGGGGVVAVDKDKMQNLVKPVSGAAVNNGAGAAPGVQGAQGVADASSSGIAANPNNAPPSSAPEPEPLPSNQNQTETQSRRSRTPTPTRAQALNNVNDAAAAGAGFLPTNGRGPIPVRPAVPSSSSANPSRSGNGANTSLYQQGGSSVLQKLQQQHQQRMNSTAMPSLDVYMGASGGDPSLAGKMPILTSQPVVPKLNFRSGNSAGDKAPLVSKSARDRPQSKGATPKQGQSSSHGSSTKQQSGPYSARDALPSDPIVPLDFGSLAVNAAGTTEALAAPMPAELLGPDAGMGINSLNGIPSENDRPSTRRSRLRLRGGDYNPEEGRPQSAAGGLDVPNDTVTNAAPVVMHNPDGSDATSTLRVVSTHQQQQPSSGRSSSSGGRKGRHIKAPVETPDSFPMPEGMQDAQ